jgi:16S rRNA (cytidine1402-2'-O)-methyltransferase
VPDPLVPDPLVPDPLAPGLYLVATPIGNARDITLRTIDILRSAEVLAAEDTRSLRRLMEIHAIPLGGRPLVPYHDHNGPAARPRLLAALRAGRSVAYASEAGTPLVADPGYQLVRAAVAEGAAVTAAPGASALLAALTVAGLPTDRFLFAGFPPSSPAARRRFLDGLAGVPATIVMFESPRRVRETLADLVAIFGSEREAALCRELTKRFEEVRRETLGALERGLADATLRGEVVFVVAPPGAAAAPDPAAVDTALRLALVDAGTAEAASAVARQFGLARRAVYQRALALSASADGAAQPDATGNDPREPDHDG